MIYINEATIKEAEDKIKIFALANDYGAAYWYYKNLAEAVKAINNEAKRNNQIFFNKLDLRINKLKFIALNYFDDWEEVGELIENYFDLTFSLEGYDLWEKVKINLSTMRNLQERSKVKELIKNRLLNSKCRILNANKYKSIKNLPITISDWLKNYHANLGLRNIDNLKRIEYLTSSNFIKRLSAEDKNKLNILFNFYEKIKIPSTDRYGFEGEVPMIIDGKDVIFSNGEAEELSPNLLKMIRDVKLADNSNNDIEELKQLATQYPAGSLERKAIGEEIEKLEVTKS